MAIRQANPVDSEIETKTTSVEDQVDKGVEDNAAAPASPEPEATTSQAVEDRAAASSAVLEEEPEDPAPPVEEPQAQASKQVATAATGGAVGTSRVQGAFLQQILKDLQDEGFEGTELDYSSFLNVTLNKQIETSEGQELPNTGFMVRLASARTKYCFRNNNPVDDEVEVAYSYNRDDDKVEGSQVFEAIKKWREEGLELGDVKEYKEVLAVMLDDKVEGDAAGELNGKLITIQVPPTSKGRWGGFLTQLKMAGIKNISDVKVLVRRGKKVESGKFPFYPWDFVNKGRIEVQATDE